MHQLAQYMRVTAPTYTAKKRRKVGSPDGEDAE